MSYLNPSRLHFFGQFQAATSTVNNDRDHFNNQTFTPEDQERGDGATKGWWNPRGDANWRFIGCNITSAFLDTGASSLGDPVLSCTLADSDHQVAAKLVDLDPDQQLVSEVWGLQVRIADSSGKTLLRAKYEVAAFMNIWTRWPTGGGDGAASALYQSVLTNLEWGNVSLSPVLMQLKAAASDGLLSIKFNVDAFDANFKSPTFTLGRIAGTIGPATAAEPKHMVLGRHFMTAANPSGGGFFAPAGGINFCEAVINTDTNKIYLDLGNSLPTDTFGGSFTDQGALSLNYITTDPTTGAQTAHLIDNIDYKASGWYQNTAGVVAAPACGVLTKGALDLIANNPLALLFTDSTGKQNPGIYESPNGMYVRADKYVYRLNPGDVAKVDLYATLYGQPYAGAEVFSYLDPTILGPLTGTPPDKVHFQQTLTTNAKGHATLAVTGLAPGNPRQFIDGQIYSIRPALVNTLPPSVQYPFNQWDFVSILVWDDFTPESPVVWDNCLEPIFTQYANLYPIMQRFLDMSSYDDVTKPRNVTELKNAFGLNANDPNIMPVTRDLSLAKRNAILFWLKHPGPDGRPLKSRPGVAAAVVAPAASVAKPAGISLMNGGKLAALERIRILNKARRTL